MKMPEEKRRKRFTWVLDPRTVLWVSYWDLVTTACLLFTATVTPYEVAFLQPPSPERKWGETLFLMNRAIDVVFILDMILQFRIAYRTVGSDVHWEFRPNMIALNYVCSKWFWLDLFAVLTLLFDVVGNEDTKDLTVLRAIRALRLAKLIRLLRGSRIFKAWEMRLSINYAYLELFTVTVLIIAITHWWACVWGLRVVLPARLMATRQGLLHPLGRSRGPRGCPRQPASQEWLLSVGTPDARRYEHGLQRGHLHRRRARGLNLRRPLADVCLPSLTLLS